MVPLNRCRCEHAATCHTIARILGWAIVAAATLMATDRAALGQSAAADHFAINNAHILLAPYVWKLSGAGETARAEATMPGAYFRAAFKGSATLDVMIDGTANRDCPADGMPVVEYSIDGGQFQAVQLTRQDKLAALSVAGKLDKDVPHRVEFYFRSSRLWPDRWGSPATHLRLAGLVLEAGGSLLPCPARPKRAIGFGDSITEGVCSEGLCPYYSNLMLNSARVTWFPVVATALDCEYGQLGSGGQGMLKPMALPPLPQSWDRYDAATSRLTEGRLVPEPDYVFCCMGTNDFQGEGPGASNWTLRPPMSVGSSRCARRVRGRGCFA